MNPPFPHEKTDTPSERFVERALEALKPRGKLAVILPTSLLVKGGIAAEWRESILKDHTLLAVCQLPDELFQPHASSTTSIVALEKGVPQNPQRTTTFVRIHYDGLTLKKSARIPRKDGKNELPRALDAALNKTASPGFSGTASVHGSAEWSVGAYIKSAWPGDEELKESIDELLRRWASFYTYYAPQVANQRAKILAEELVPHPYRERLGKQRLKNAKELPARPGTVGTYFDLFYGQKALHSRDGMMPGDTLVISPTEQYNGCYGWLTFDDLIDAPFITVAGTGTIGEAFVQTEACAVNDDCLILLPKEGKELPLATLFIAAAQIRQERWRFNYGRKLTPARICEFAMERSLSLENWVNERLNQWQAIAETAVQACSVEEAVLAD